METKDSRLSNTVGTKSTVLKPSDVEILDMRIETVDNKETGKGGEKVVFSCKHPQNKDAIEISGVKYQKGDSLETSGLWYKVDEDGKINKDSVLSSFLNFLGVESIEEVGGKKVATISGNKGFLVFKAY